jgi:hypothetical protein
MNDHHSRNGPGQDTIPQIECPGIS